MVSYKVQYRGTTYITRNVSLGDETLDNAANCEYKNATAYGKIMMLEGGKIMDAWEKAVAPAKLQQLPGITDATVTEEDGYLIIKGKDKFADVSISKDSIILNGEVIWSVQEKETPVTEENASVEESPSEDKEKPVSTVEEKPVAAAPTEESHTAKVEEKSDSETAEEKHEEAAKTAEVHSAEDVPMRGNGKTHPIGMKLGKNGQHIQHTYGEFVLGIKVVENPNPHRMNIPVGNDNWRRWDPKKEREEREEAARKAAFVSQEKEQPEEQVQPVREKPKFTKRRSEDDTQHSVVGQQVHSIMDVPKEEASGWMPEHTSVFTNLTRQEVHDIAQSAPRVIKEPDPEVAAIRREGNAAVSLSKEETQALMGIAVADDEVDKAEQQKAANAVWTEALQSHTVLDGEKESTVLPENDIQVNSLGEPDTPAVAVEAVDLPDWFDMVPKALLKNLNSFTTRNIADSVVDNDYVLVDRWDKLGSWYATDIVDSAERIFYNSQDSKVYRAKFGQCKQYLQKVGDE